MWKSASASHGQLPLRATFQLVGTYSHNARLSPNRLRVPKDFTISSLLLCLQSGANLRAQPLIGLPGVQPARSVSYRIPAVTISIPLEGSAGPDTHSVRALEPEKFPDADR